MSQQELLPENEGRAKYFLIVYLSVLLSGICLLLLLAGIILNWHSFLTASNIFVQMFLILAVVLTPVTIISFCVFKGTLAFYSLRLRNEDLKAKQDERRRLNEEHHTKLHL